MKLLASQQREYEAHRSNICNHEDFVTKEYEEFCSLLWSKNKRIHRKQWEFYIIHKKLSEHLGNFDSKLGLGFAVGQEELVPLFVKLNASITASDLDPNDDNAKDWIKTNQHMKNGFERYISTGYIEKDFFEKNCAFEYINMNNIPIQFLNNTYDFIWSSCALEHLGSIQNGLDFIINSLKCLKKGGIAVHTTEFNFKSNDITLETKGCVSFRKKDFDWLIQTVESLGYYIEPINYNRADTIVNNYVDKYPYNGSTSAIFFDLNNYDVLKTHINLEIDGHCSTSIYLLIINK
jgi:hypothetical protein